MNLVDTNCNEEKFPRSQTSEKQELRNKNVMMKAENMTKNKTD